MAKGMLIFKNEIICLIFMHKELRSMFASVLALKNDLSHVAFSVHLLFEMSLGVKKCQESSRPKICGFCVVFCYRKVE